MEVAARFVNASLDREVKLAYLREASRYLNRFGITSIVNATGDLAEIELYATLRERGEREQREPGEKVLQQDEDPAGADQVRPHTDRRHGRHPGRDRPGEVARGEPVHDAPRPLVAPDVRRETRRVAASASTPSAASMPNASTKARPNC